MRVTSVSVKHSQKFNTGNFTSLDLEVSIWAQLDSGDDASAVIDSLQEEARLRVLEDFKIATATNGKPTIGNHSRATGWPN